jgi:hypothetical protein
MEILNQDKSGISLKLNLNEIIMLNNSMNEVLEKIEDWEFQTRIGYSKDEIRKLLNQFEQLN